MYEVNYEVTRFLLVEIGVFQKIIIIIFLIINVQIEQTNKNDDQGDSQSVLLQIIRTKKHHKQQEL